MAWGDRSFFAHPARIVVSVALLLFTVLPVFSGMSGFSSGKGNKKDYGSFAWVWFLSLVSAWVSPWSDRRNFWTLDGNGLRCLGTFIFVFGVWLRVGAMYALGHRFSPSLEIQDNHSLETRGIYTYIRHPSYLGGFLVLAGWGVCFRSIPGILISFLLWPVILMRIKAEEVFLVSEFGADYVNYQRRSWKLVPFFY